jgi:quinol monooxygenase YgiN
MYGTVARMQLQPGKEGEFEALAKDFEGLSVPGYLGTYLYRLDADPTTILMAVAFKDKASYEANAQSAVQHSRYEQMRALLAADPEWQDGEIIYPAG